MNLEKCGEDAKAKKGPAAKLENKKGRLSRINKRERNRCKHPEKL